MSELTYEEDVAQAQAIGISEIAAAAQFGTLEEQHLQVDLLEEAMECLLETEQLQPEHAFEHGMYVRTLSIPAGTLITSEIHRTAHVCILSQGSINVWTVGGPTVNVSAPYAFISAPGSRRVGYTLEDVVWTTIHDTDKTDITEIEQDIFVKREAPKVRAANRMKELACPA
jgi:hypothetical protein